ncbi:MAG TPA: PAS domain-containing protein, partial [Gammaproteobacteria bacterium]
MRPPDIKSATGDSAQSAGVTGRSRQAAMDPEILLLVLDGSATIVGCNNVVCEFSGRRRHDLVGTPITAFLGSRDVETAISRSAPEGAGCAWIGTTRLGGTRRKVDWRLDPFAVD